MTKIEPSVSRLGENNLDTLGALVATPTYDRAELARSIVHIGVGGFHRAHLAAYIHELAAKGNDDWAIVGAGILPGDKAMAEALESQNYLYTLVTRGPDEVKTQIIGSIVDYVLADEQPELLVEVIAKPETQIVSLTLTEGGYPVDEDTGKFVAKPPLAGPDAAFGIIARGLAAREKAGAGPITIMSCDNILGNGDATHTATVGEAALINTELVDWVENNVTFPNSMVDGITPATTASDRIWLKEQIGIDDAWPVFAEPFKQWAIEDKFAGKRLPLEELDVIVTNKVEPYEQMKLRLLNASHSCLAYLSALVGHKFVHDAMADAHINKYVLAFLTNEAVPVLAPVQGIDAETYVQSLAVRFSNPQIADQVARLCLGGTAKFPKFLIPTIADQLKDGGNVKLSALGLAGWCQYLLGKTESGEIIEVSPDQHLELAQDLAKASLKDPTKFLDLGEVFSQDIATDKRFVDAFVEALEMLRSDGTYSAIDQLT